VITKIVDYQSISQTNIDTTLEMSETLNNVDLTILAQCLHEVQEINKIYINCFLKFVEENTDNMKMINNNLSLSLDMFNENLKCMLSNKYNSDYTILEKKFNETEDIQDLLNKMFALKKYSLCMTAIEMHKCICRSVYRIEQSIIEKFDENLFKFYELSDNLKKELILLSENSSDKNSVLEFCLNNMSDVIDKIISDNFNHF